MSTDRELLDQAENALHSVAMRLLAVSPQLKEPYADAPEHSPWSLHIGPQARRAHDLARTIRKHLGLPCRHATRALGTPPLEIDDVIADAVAGERERIRRMAIELHATVVQSRVNGVVTSTVPFADLIGEDL